MIELIEISETFEVKCDAAAPRFDEDIMEAVNDVWKRATKTQPWLFDGKALAVSRLTRDLLECFELPYRFFFAKANGIELDLTPAAVSGVLICNGQIFFGKRSGNVTTQRGQLELVPSGTLPGTDFRAQLLTELQEEINVPSQNVSSVVPFCCVNEKNRVLDVCCKLIVEDQRVDMITEGFKADEYDWLSSLTLDELSAKVRNEEQNWVPASAAIIKHLAEKS